MPTPTPKLKATPKRIQTKQEDYSRYEQLATQLGLSSVSELFRVFYTRYSRHLRDTWELTPGGDLPPTDKSPSDKSLSLSPTPAEPPAALDSSSPHSSSQHLAPLEF